MILAAPPTLDLGIGRGDDSPPLSWAMSFAVLGSDFDLVINSPSTQPVTLGLPVPAPTVLTLTVSGGDLVLDPIANTVSWPATSAESEALPYASTYTLRRTVPEVRYYAAGRIFGLDGPVGPSSVTVQVAGPQGPLPSNAQIVAAVESVLGQPGGIAPQDALTGEIARAKAAETANAASIAAEVTRAEGIEAGLFQQQLAAMPKSYPIAIVSRGQTAVPMPTPPTLLSSVRLIVNFCEYAAPVIGATATTLTWLNADFPLEPSDNVLLTYV